jgi:hypothetical protein
LVIVSKVVKVFEETINRVSDGSSTAPISPEAVRDQTR